MVRAFSDIRVFRRRKPIHIRRKDLLGLSDFRRLAHGQFVSQSADAATTVLTAQFVFFSTATGPTRSILIQSVISAAIPLFLAGPISGILADKFSRNSILARGQILRATICALLFMAAISNYKLLVLLLFGFGLCISKVMYTVRVSTIRHLVRQHELVAADSLLLTLGNFAAATGGVIGVLTLQFLDLGGLLLVVAGHLLASAKYKRIQVSLGGGNDRDSTSWTLVIASFWSIKTRYAFLAVGAHRFIYGTLFASLSLFLDSQSSNSYALLVGVAGAGTFAGNLTAEWVNEHLPRKSTTVLVFLLSATAGLLCAFSPRFPVFLATILTTSFLFQNLRVCSDATVQKYAPRGAGGRVLATYDLVCNTSFLSGLLCGLTFASTSVTKEVIVLVTCSYAGMAVLLGAMTRRVPQDGTEVRNLDEQTLVETKTGDARMIQSQLSLG